MYKAHRCQVSPLLSDLQVSRLYKFSNPGTCLILFLFRCHNWRSSGPTLTSRVASRSRLNMTSQVYRGTGRGIKNRPPTVTSSFSSGPWLGLDTRIRQSCRQAVVWTLCRLRPGTQLTWQRKRENDYNPGWNHFDVFVSSQLLHCFTYQVQTGYWVVSLFSGTELIRNTL